MLEDLASHFVKVNLAHSSSTSESSIPAATPSPIITRTRASSSPPINRRGPIPTPARDSTSLGSNNQCNGITTAGKRCTRIMKARTSSEPVKRFCYQHSGSNDQCDGITTAGNRCARVMKAPTSGEGASEPVERFCYQHSGSNNQCHGITTAGKRCTRIMKTRTSSEPIKRFCYQHSGSNDQCNGVTEAGKRCARVMKASTSSEPASKPVERFCYRHLKVTNTKSGFYSRKEGAGWVKFADCIPDYLHADTQAALRVEMEKPVSEADTFGYIYVFEMRDKGELNELQMKVGRAANPVKRFDEWSRHCTKEVVLRGWWPGGLEDKANRISMLSGKIVTGEKGPYCHRLERLVHLELADLAANFPYLDPEFPKTTVKAGRSPKPTKLHTPGRLPCEDCGAVHREIFTFRRATTRKYKNMEWERLVKPVIERWGTFVKQFV